jgi:hypothetical protein
VTAGGASALPLRAAGGGFARRPYEALLAQAMHPEKAELFAGAVR